MREVFDHIVIGAGLGGLSAACLLQEQGKHVLLLEAHNSVGGCASYFARKKFLFDVGATTLSGMKHDQPVQRLLRRLNIDMDVHLCDPGMVIRMNGKTFRRWIDTDRWIAECEQFFGAAHQRKFWTLVHSIADDAWKASASLKNLPLHSVRDLLSLPAMVRHASLVPYLFRSVNDILKEIGLSDNKDFVRFISEQLMITAQADVHDTPFAVGAIGLAYPSDTWYVNGGMNNFPRLLQKNFTANGGMLLLKKKVISVESDTIHKVTTDDGKIFYGRTVISNATGWDNKRIFPAQEQFFDKEYSSLGGWGAFVGYFGVADTPEIGNDLYQQIILESPLPHCGSNSIFLSFSAVNDASRASSGYRALTVSTHMPDPAHWWKLSEHESSIRKGEIGAAMTAVLNERLPSFLQAERPVEMFGTPVTFENFTHRAFGQVGGIPQSMHRPLFFWPGSTTDTRGVYVVGDTIYPGQGAPGVILGALNLADRLTK
ncbi:MAG: phytoene desaturase family protein [Bacteroidota bacterium]